MAETCPPPPHVLDPGTYMFGNKDCTVWGRGFASDAEAWRMLRAEFEKIACIDGKSKCRVNMVKFCRAGFANTTPDIPSDETVEDMKGRGIGFAFP
jgi:hypothetical protein